MEEVLHNNLLKIEPSDIHARLGWTRAGTFWFPAIYLRSCKRQEQSGFRLDGCMIQNEPLWFHDYNCLQMNAFCVVPDNGAPRRATFIRPRNLRFQRCASALPQSGPKRWIRAALCWRALMRIACCRKWIPPWRWISAPITAFLFRIMLRKTYPPRRLGASKAIPAWLIIWCEESTDETRSK